MSSTQQVFKIIPTTQQYDWGKIGNSAKVAQFAVASRLPGFAINEKTPYAELWMGTHPKSPSHVLSTGEELSKHLAAHPQLIGKDVISKFDAGEGNLPFLFKVLSIEKALSIQSHPDKPTAEKLFLSQPDIYKDPNHKPEMTLALTPFNAMCGFRPLPALATALQSTPELAALIPGSILQHFLSLALSPTAHVDPTGPAEKAALRDVFSAVMTASTDIYTQHLDILVSRYKAGNVNPGEEPERIALVLRLADQFPGDIGIFCAFLLNYVNLQPGEAIFLGAGEPHAYVSGECMECMANSDNVIRAGLTPKLRDVPNLVATLTYNASEPGKHAVSPVPFSSEKGPSTLYNPPIPEFSVIQVKLPSDLKEETHRPVQGPSIGIVTGGGGVVNWGNGELELRLGDVFFIGAGVEVKFGNRGEGELVVYRAFVES
ncbi:mannose-6-phosphate isomerase [Collybia nuda]|uniref:Mannose-6-phosphate isomerase n=1 Tax=Collybia nuda TaxID=64659 RepID=A0A9P6CM65_9AGAR|nr:mannose-6-phosphate isomerase [Collybia nuda]